MTMDWSHFTPWASLAGGILIGIAAGALILANGRVLGVSGIIGGLIHPGPQDAAWRIAFVLGMLAAPLSFALLSPAGFLPPARIDAGLGMVIAAGLLVGFGTRLGSGCTSGHGVCGLSRLSLRSLVATLAFMATGALTVFVVRHV